MMNEKEDEQAGPVYAKLNCNDVETDDEFTSNEPSNYNVASNDDISDDDDDDDDDDLLEPFPEPSINHERKPIEADIDPEEDDKDLRPGDHIYVWKSYGMLGVRTYQKHGIVLSVDPNDGTNLTIVTFYHRNTRSAGACAESNDDDGNGESLLKSHCDNSVTSSRNNGTKNQTRTATVRTESLSTFVSNSKGKVFKVKYGLGLAKRLLRRGGTVSSCTADENALILARVKYLLETPGRMPEYQMMSANGECAAVWCRIGRWCTLQGSSILHILFVGQAGGAVAGGVVASNVMLWAPMPGLWGSIGYIWYVPATIAFPLLTPLLIGFGLASLVPLEVLRRYRKRWAQISKDMNTDFWAKTSHDIRSYYYNSTISSDENWMKSFFGEKDDTEEMKKGNYMPLDTNGDAIAVEEDEDEDEMSKRISEEYGMHFDKLQQEEQEKCSTEKNVWQNMLGRMKTPFRTQRTSQVTANDNIVQVEATKPLNEEVCKGTI